MLDLDLDLEIARSEAIKWVFIENRNPDCFDPPLLQILDVVQFLCFSLAERIVDQIRCHVGGSELGNPKAELKTHSTTCSTGSTLLLQNHN